MEGPLREAESGGPELDPTKDHIYVAGVGVGGGITACADLGRPGSGIPGMRSEMLPLCSLFSARPCLLAQWLLNQTDLDPTPRTATLKLCDPRQVSEPLWTLIFNL